MTVSTLTQNKDFQKLVHQANLMSGKLYTLNALEDYLISSKVVKKVKVTLLENVGFNSMEGNLYRINVHVFTQDGWKNKLVKVYTNDSCIEDYATQDESESFKQMKQDLQDGLNDLIY